MAARTISRFRVSLSMLLVLTAVIGLSLAALSQPSSFWLTLMQAVVVASVAVCAAMAVAGRSIRDRAFPLAFIAAVLINSYMRLPESPIASLVARLVELSLPNGGDSFPTNDQWVFFKLTLVPVISLLLGTICGWIAFSLAKAPENDGATHVHSV